MDGTLRNLFQIPNWFIQKQTQHQPDILTITIPSVEARLEKQKQILDLITLGNLKKIISL